jgi:hypothetical protein
MLDDFRNGMECCVAIKKKYRSVFELLLSQTRRG